MNHEDQEEPVTIYTAADSAQASILSEELDRRGIRNAVENEALQTGGAEVMGLAVDPKIVVARKDEAVAREIAQAFDQAIVKMAKKDGKCGDSGSCGCSPDTDGALAIAEMLKQPLITPDDEAPWPTCSRCQEPRQTACPICGTVGGDFPRADFEFSEALPPDSEAQFTVLCTTCDDPFVPEWLKTCGNCGANFGESEELTQAVAQIEPHEPMNSRIVLVACLLFGILAGLGIYFTVIADRAIQ